MSDLALIYRFLNFIDLSKNICSNIRMTTFLRFATKWQRSELHMVCPIIFSGTPTDSARTLVKELTNDNVEHDDWMVIYVGYHAEDKEFNIILGSSSGDMFFNVKGEYFNTPEYPKYRSWIEDRVPTTLEVAFVKFIHMTLNLYEKMNDCIVSECDYWRDLIDMVHTVTEDEMLNIINGILDLASTATGIHYSLFIFDQLFPPPGMPDHVYGIRRRHYPFGIVKPCKYKVILECEANEFCYKFFNGCHIAEGIVAFVYAPQSLWGLRAQPPIYVTEFGVGVNLDIDGSVPKLMTEKAAGIYIDHLVEESSLRVDTAGLDNLLSKMLSPFVIEEEEEQFDLEQYVDEVD